MRTSERTPTSTVRRLLGRALIALGLGTIVVPMVLPLERFYLGTAFQTVRVIRSPAMALAAAVTIVVLILALIRGRGPGVLSFVGPVALFLLAGFSTAQGPSIERADTRATGSFKVGWWSRSPVCWYSPLS